MASIPWIRKMFWKMFEAARYIFVMSGKENMDIG